MSVGELDGWRRTAVMGGLFGAGAQNAGVQDAHGLAGLSCCDLTALAQALKSSVALTEPRPVAKPGALGEFGQAGNAR
jgi:hypothetical protein